MQTLNQSFQSEVWGHWDTQMERDFAQGQGWFQKCSLASACPKAAVPKLFPTDTPMQVQRDYFYSVSLCIVARSREINVCINFYQMFPQHILTMSDWDSKGLLNYIQIPIKSPHWQ